MRLIVVTLGLVLVLATLAAYFYERHIGRDHRGSSTVEFTTTQSIPIPPSPTLEHKIVWPEFGYDAARSHVGPTVAAHPPFRLVWTAGGRSFLEFPPAIAYGRLYIADGSGRVLAFSTKTGARRWTNNAPPCQAASPVVDDLQHGTVYEVFFIWQDAYQRGGRFDVPEFDLFRGRAVSFGGNFDRTGQSMWGGGHPRSNRWALRWSVSTASRSLAATSNHIVGLPIVVPFVCRLLPAVRPTRIRRRPDRRHGSRHRDVAEPLA